VAGAVTAAAAVAPVAAVAEAAMAAAVAAATVAAAADAIDRGFVTRNDPRDATCFANSGLQPTNYKQVRARLFPPASPPGAD